MAVDVPAFPRMLSSDTTPEADVGWVRLEIKTPRLAFADRKRDETMVLSVVFLKSKTTTVFLSCLVTLSWFFFFLLERAGYSCGIFVPSCWHFWVAGSSNSQSGINEAKKKTLGTLHHVLLWVLNPAFFFIHFRVFFYLFYVHCPGF